eukprot:1161279-Pelagomonas_calceolata.AAC.10
MRCRREHGCKVLKQGAPVTVWNPTCNEAAPQRLVVTDGFQYNRVTHWVVTGLSWWTGAHLALNRGELTRT